MSLVRLKQITKKYEHGSTERLVLRDVSFRLMAGERVGLIGKNGSGKTTILRLVLGLEEPAEGTVEIAEGVRIGYFSQFSELDGEATVEQVLEGVLEEVRDVEREMQTVEMAMETTVEPEALQELCDRHAGLLERMEHMGGWTYRNRIDTVLSKLGFTDAYRRRPVSELSGGWKNRAALAKILLEEPDVLLLDEPTNFLDIAGITWLEGWLQKFKGAMVIVSHDRDFLDRMATRIVEIEAYRTHEYEGNFSAYVRERPFRLKQIQSAYAYEEELLAYEAEAVRERKDLQKDPTNALKRRLANIKKSVEPRPVDRVVTSLYANLRVPAQVLEVTGLSRAIGGTSLFSGLSFRLGKEERLAIVGPNGCGKSTLLRTLTGEGAADAGEIQWLGGSACVSFNRMLETMETDKLVKHVIHGLYGIVDKAPRKIVAQFLEMMQFSERDMETKAGNLSGGQRSRLALAKCLLSGAQVLALDEPTNHLDMTSIQVMERALVHFPGAVIAVSHDRFFLDKVATRLLVFEERGLRQVEGNFSTWAGAADQGA